MIVNVDWSGGGTEETSTVEVEHKESRRGEHHYVHLHIDGGGHMGGQGGVDMSSVEARVIAGQLLAAADQAEAAQG